MGRLEITKWQRNSAPMLSTHFHYFSAWAPIWRVLALAAIRGPTKRKPAPWHCATLRGKSSKSIYSVWWPFENNVFLHCAVAVHCASPKFELSLIPPLKTFKAHNH